MNLLGQDATHTHTRRTTCIGNMRSMQGTYARMPEQRVKTLLRTAVSFERARARITFLAARFASVFRSIQQTSGKCPVRCLLVCFGILGSNLSPTRQPVSNHRQVRRFGDLEDRFSRASVSEKWPAAQGEADVAVGIHGNIRPWVKLQIVPPVHIPIQPLK